MDEGTLYFAYGSNINLNQMAYRCPNAEVVGPVVLKDYKLLFRGNSRGNGVATIKPHKGRKVYGLLWKITPECEQSLDIYEGFPRLYDKQMVTVQDKDGQEFSVMAYVMTDLCREPSMPSNSYFKGIVEGYRQNGLPTPSLTRAWEHCVREVHTLTERTNSQLSQRPKPRKGRNNHER